MPGSKFLIIWSHVLVSNNGKANIRAKIYNSDGTVSISGSINT